MAETAIPFDGDAEAGVLACVLSCASSESGKLLDALEEDLFHDLRHVSIFRSLLSLQSDNKPLDTVSLFEVVKASDELPKCGGFEYLSSLPDKTHSPEHFPAFLEIVKDRCERRRLLREAQSTRAKALDLSIPVQFTTKFNVSAVPIGDLHVPPQNDPTELLKHRFLCQKGSLLFSGPTGVGKSSWVMQAAALWSCGLEAFGITPTRPLRSLIIQAENDDGDLAEMRDGICTGLKLTLQQRQTFFSQVIVHSSNGIVGKAFCSDVVSPLLSIYHPDLFVIDPALSFVGGAVKDQQVVTEWLRTFLNPLIFAHNCACLMSHHTNKPVSGREKPEWRNGEMAYLGTGSAEWANWARAILSLQSTGEHGIYRLHAAKRGARIGWKNGDDERVYEKLIAHSKEKGLIYWRDAQESELPDAGGRPAKFTYDELLSLITPASLSTSDWRDKAKDELGISKTSFHRIVNEMKLDQRITQFEGRWEVWNRR